MSSSATIQVRVDPPTKAQAMDIFRVLGISLSEGVCLFLRQVVMRRGIPFELKIPSELTDKVLRESEQGVDLRAVSTVDELFEDLERDDSLDRPVQKRLQTGRKAGQGSRRTKVSRREVGGTHTATGQT
jgi:DNA-damage-inducible protein J